MSGDNNRACKNTTNDIEKYCSKVRAAKSRVVKIYLPPNPNVRDIDPSPDANIRAIDAVPASDGNVRYVVVPPISTSTNDTNVTTIERYTQILNDRQRYITRINYLPITNFAAISSTNTSITFSYVYTNKPLNVYYTITAIPEQGSRPGSITVVKKYKNSFEYTVSDLSFDTTYILRLQASSYYGLTEPVYSSFTTIQIPDQINDLSFGNVTNTTVDLNFTSPPQYVENYYVTLKHVGNGQVVRAMSFPHSQSQPYTVTELSFNTLYNLYITAGNNNGNSVPAVVRFKTKQRPDTPSGVTFTSITNSSFDFNFTPPPQYVDTYTFVVRNIASNFSATYLKTRYDSLPYEITDLSFGTLYNISLTATNIDGSSNVATTSVTTKQIPDAITDLTESAKTNNSITITFTPPIQPINTYTVYVRDTGNVLVTTYPRIFSGTAPLPFLLDNLSLNTYYNISLLAENSDGNTIATRLLRTLNLPLPPSSTSFISSTNTNVTINVVPPEQSNNIQQYETNVYTIGGTFIKKSIESFPRNTITITGLSFGTRYYIEVFSKNNDGYSQVPSIVSGNIVTTALPDTPTSFVITSITNTTLDVSFIRPPQPVDQYVIDVYKGNTISQYYYDNSQYYDGNASIQSLPLTITGLLQGNVYILSLYATSVFGNSDKISVSTSTSEKPDPPTNLIVTNITNTFVDLSFTKPTLPVDYYSIVVYERTSYPTGSSQEFNNLGNIPEPITIPYRLSLLVYNRLYEIYLTATKGNTKSDPANVSFTTKQIPDPPSSIRATLITNTFVDLDFTRPEQYVAKYIVTPNYLHGNTFIASSPFIFDGSQSRPFRITDLSYDSTYNIYIDASNSDGVGSGNILLTTKNAPSNITDIQTANITNSTLDLKFLRPPQSVTQYTVQVYNTSNTSTSSLSFPDTSYNITGRYKTVPITDLSFGITYNCIITAINTDGVGTGSTIFTTKQVPDPVSNVVVTNTTNTYIDVSFIAPAQPVTNYILSGTDGFNRPIANITYTASDELPLRFTDLSFGTTYSLRITASNSDGVGEYNMATIKTKIVPDALTNVIASLRASSYIDISFTRPPQPIDYYTITAIIAGATQASNTYSGNASLPLRISGLTIDTTYNIVVDASNSDGVGSGSVTTTTIFAIDPPSNFTATAITNTTISVSFTSPAQTISSYLLYTYLSGVLLKTQTIGAYDRPPIDISGLTYNTTYDLSLVAVINGYTSISPATLRVTTKQVPDAPTITDVTATNTAATITFTSPPQTVTSYRLVLTPSVGSPITEYPTASPYTVSTLLTPGISYTVELYAINADGTSAAGTSSFSTSQVPDPPSGLSVTSRTKTSLTLSFTAPLQSVNRFDYKYKPRTSNNVISGNINFSPFTISDLSFGVTYDISLNAVSNTYGPSIYVGTSGTTTQIPQTPIITGNIIDNSSIAISFTAPPEPVTNYTITAKQFGPGTLLGPYTLANTVSSYTFSSLPFNTIYDISLTATNSDGTSSPYTATYRTRQVPDAPTNLITTGQTNTTVDISFSYPPQQVYNIYVTPYLSGNALSTQMFGIVGGLPLTVTGLTDNTTYNLSVYVTNGDGTSPTISLSATTKNVPNTPTDFIVIPSSITNTTMDVSFNPPSQLVTSYTITASAAGLDDIVINYTGNTPPALPTLPFRISGLLYNTGYTIKLVATNTQGSYAPATLNAITAYNIEPPSSLIVTSKSFDFIDISFVKPPQIVNFNLYVSTLLANTVYYNYNYTQDLPIRIDGLYPNTSYDISLNANTATTSTSFVYLNNIVTYAVLYDVSYGNITSNSIILDVSGVYSKITATRTGGTGGAYSFDIVYPATSYTDATVIADTSYAYLLQPFNSTNDIQLLDISNLPVVYTKASGNISAISNVTSSSLRINWSGIYYYATIVRNLGGNSITGSPNANLTSSNLISSVNGYVTDTGLLPNTVYSYTVTLNNFIGNTTIISSDISAVTYATIYTASYGNLTTSSFSIDISGVYSNVAVTGNTSFSIVSPAITSVVSGLSTNTLYSYTLTPYNSRAVAGNATSLGNKYTLATVAQSAYTNILSTSVQINWTGIYNSVVIYRNAGAGNILVSSFTSSSNITSPTPRTSVTGNAVDDGLTSGTTYTYYLYAVNGDNVQTIMTTSPINVTTTNNLPSASVTPFTSGEYNVYTFNTNGTITFSRNTFINYLVVGGGGGGGGGTYNLGGANSLTNCGGSGGSGGVITTGTITITAGTYSITVGNGGNGGNGASSNNTSSPGNGESSIFGTIQSSGGTRGNPGSGRGPISGGYNGTIYGYGGCGGTGNTTLNVGNRRIYGNVGMSITVGTTVYNVGGGGSGSANGNPANTNPSITDPTYGMYYGGADAVTNTSGNSGTINTGGGGGGGGTSGAGGLNGGSGGTGIVVVWISNMYIVSGNISPITNVTNNSLQVNWSGIYNNAVITRNQGNVVVSSSPNSNLISSNPASSVSGYVTDIGLSPNSLYSYTITIISTTGNTIVLSSDISAVTLASGNILSISDVSTNLLRINWSGIYSNAIITRNQGSVLVSGSPNSNLTSSNPASTVNGYVTDTSLLPNTFYSYTVSLINSSGSSTVLTSNINTVTYATITSVTKSTTFYDYDENFDPLYTLTITVNGSYNFISNPSYTVNGITYTGYGNIIYSPQSTYSTIGKYGQTYNFMLIPYNSLNIGIREYSLEVYEPTP